MGFAWLLKASLQLMYFVVVVVSCLGCVSVSPVDHTHFHVVRKWDH